MGSGLVGASITGSASLVTAAPAQANQGFTAELEEQGFSQYKPDSTLHNGDGNTPDGEGTYQTRTYHKVDLTSEIQEKSNGMVNRPGAVFFEQKLSGDWSGSWNINGSLGEVSSETKYEFKSTSNIDISLINIKFSPFSPTIHADYTKENTTIENQTVGGDSGSESLVSPHAIGQITSTFENILLESGCMQLRYSEGLWRDMRAGESYVAHDDEIDYVKSGFAMTHRTYNAEWQGAEASLTEGVDRDEFNNHVNVRAYLSIESRGGNTHLAVGGFYVNEEEVEFNTGLTSTPEVQTEGESVHNEIIQLMRSRTLES